MWGKGVYPVPQTPPSFFLMLRGTGLRFGIGHYYHYHYCYYYYFEREKDPHWRFYFDVTVYLKYRASGNWQVQTAPLTVLGMKKNYHPGSCSGPPGRSWRAVATATSFPFTGHTLMALRKLHPGSRSWGCWAPLVARWSVIDGAVEPGPRRGNLTLSLLWPQSCECLRRCFCLGVIASHQHRVLHCPGPMWTWWGMLCPQARRGVGDGFGGSADAEGMLGL